MTQHKSDLFDNIPSIQEAINDHACKLISIKDFEGLLADFIQTRPKSYPLFAWYAFNRNLLKEYLGKHRIAITPLTRQKSSVMLKIDDFNEQLDTLHTATIEALQHSNNFFDPANPDHQHVALRQCLNRINNTLIRFKGAAEDLDLNIKKTNITDVLNTLAGGDNPLLQRLIGSKIKLEPHIPEQKLYAKIDPEYLDQVICILFGLIRDYQAPDKISLTLSQTEQHTIEIKINVPHEEKETIPQEQTLDIEFVKGVISSMQGEITIDKDSVTIALPNCS